MQLSSRIGKNKLQKLKLFLIGTGFFWIFAWSVFGSILGARINQIMVTAANPSWLIGVQKSVLTAAHSHMNNMAITLILFGMTISQIRGFVSNRAITLTCFLNLVSIPIFGFGMVFEAFYPTVNGNLSFFTFVVAIGAILYMMTTVVWSSFFILAYLKK